MLRPVFVPPIVTSLERKLRERVKHAQMICKNHEDTKECVIAWDHVEDLKKGIRKAKERNPVKDELCEIDPLACREYDV